MLYAESGTTMNRPPSLLRACLAEWLGTFILIFFGNGSVFVAVTTGALDGLGQVAAVWAVAIATAIYAVGAVSGAHINPAVTLACSVWCGFPRRQVLPYIFAQLLGAVCAAATLYGLYHGYLAHFESAHGLVRGEAGSQLSAMVFGEYFPNPGVFGTDPEAFATISFAQAMAAEMIGTAFLVFFVLSLIDQHNAGRPSRALIPPAIGLAVAAIICVLSPLTQAGLNPARDFGPRLVAWMAGWGEIAIPGPRAGFFWVYIFSPFLGGIIGGGVYRYLLGHGYERDANQQVEQTRH